MTFAVVHDAKKLEPESPQDESNETFREFLNNEAKKLGSLKSESSSTDAWDDIKPADLQSWDDFVQTKEEDFIASVDPENSEK